MDDGTWWLPAAPTSSGATERLRVARAGPGHAAAVWELLDRRARWLHDHGIVDQWPAPFPATSIEPALDAGRTWIVEDHDDTVVATFTLEDVDDLWPADHGPEVAPAYLHRLATAPGHPGLGRRLLEDLSTRLADRGRTVLRLDCLTSNTGLCGYYERAGFGPRAHRTVHAVPGDGWPAGSSARVTLYERPLPPRAPES